jgi:ABC-type antimicrobial peptide transport system permease subunit
MNILEAIKISFQMLSRNKMRSFLTMLGIVIGVMAVVLVMSIGSSAQEYVLNEVKTMGTDLIGVLPGASGDGGAPASAMGIVVTSLKYEDGEDILKKNIPNILALTMFVKGNDIISYESNKMDASYSGVTASYPIVEKGEVINGRFFTEDEERNYSKVAVLGSAVAEELFGDQDPVGKKIKIKKNSFKVIGVLKEKGKSYTQDQDNTVFIPIKTAQNLLLGINHITLIRMKIADESLADETIEDVIMSLRESHNIDDPIDDDFTIRSSQEALNSLSQITGALAFFLVVVSAISLVVGGFGIMNIMLATVEERVQEIGLRKALGAKNSHIVMQFLIESVVITFISGLVGIVLGIIFSFVVYQVIELFGITWFFIIPVNSVIVATFVSIIIGIIFGIFPARKASKLNPIEALRYE